MGWQPTGLTSTTVSRPSCQVPRTPAKLRSTSSSHPCRALLMSASEVTSSLTRTETCEETCGRIQTPSAPYLRPDGQSSAAHLPRIPCFNQTRDARGACRARIVGWCSDGASCYRSEFLRGTHLPSGPRCTQSVGGAWGACGICLPRCVVAHFRSTAQESHGGAWPGRDGLLPGFVPPGL